MSGRLATGRGTSLCLTKCDAFEVSDASDQFAVNMRKAMTTLPSSPPSAVHVTMSTPGHAHSKKNPKTARLGQDGTNGGLRPTARVKTRVPWIPPGKVSTREAMYKWEGPSHRLEVTPLAEPSEPASACAHKLWAGEEEALHASTTHYRRRINDLMEEVSALRREVELCNKQQLLEQQEEELSASQRVIAQQEEELAQVAKVLDFTEQENSRLRESLGKILQESDYSRLDGESMQSEALLLKLLGAELEVEPGLEVKPGVEPELVLEAELGAELDGSAAAQQDETPELEPSVLVRQKELLLQKLETFEEMNHRLRVLLGEQHRQQMDSLRLLEQKDCLLKKLTDVQAENSRLLLKLEDKQKEVEQLTTQLENQKESSHSSSELSKVLESNRAHLQAQLRSREAENNRLNIQIRNFKRTANQQQAVLEHLQQQLIEAGRGAESDKEALKRATRKQKQRTERSQERASQLSAQLTERESQLAAAVSATEGWSGRWAAEAELRTQLQAEVSILRQRVEELVEQQQVVEQEARAEREGLTDRLHVLNAANTSALRENQSLQATLSTLEGKLTLSQSEVQQVKTSVQLQDIYKNQVQTLHKEADELRVQLARAEREGQVREQLLSRVAELEPLPEALRRAEVSLQETLERECSQEKRNSELSASLSELRMKVEQQAVQAETALQRNVLLLEENKQLQHRVAALSRKLEEADLQTCDLMQVITKREESIHNNQVRLEEKTRECGALSMRLGEALEEAQKQLSQTRERAQSTEQALQQKVLELETRLSRISTDLKQLHRTKEEVERRHRSRLQDVKDRLDQSDRTNRSLQSYVLFLKASYANTFTDAPVSSLHTHSPI